MSFDVKKIANRVAKTAPNMQEASKGGSDYTPPAAGPCMLRFVGYVEIGEQEHRYQGAVSYKNKVQLVFELHGKNYPVKELDDGTKIPVRMTVKETLSLSNKAHFFRIFNAMRNGREDITHMAQMLGEAFKGRVYHSKSKDGTKTYASLRGDAGYSIAPAVVENEDGESRPMRVPPAISNLRLFVWDDPDKEQWDSLFIDGEYDDGKSKNVLQNLVRGARNFPGSPIERLLKETGGGEDGGEFDELPDDDDDQDTGTTKQEREADPIDYEDYIPF